MDDKSPSIGVAQNKTPPHTLIRVRNNQRRHRERRRQYIAFLEEKVDHSEHLLAQARVRIAELENDCSYWKHRAAKEYTDGAVAAELMAPTEEQQQLEKLDDETLLKTALWIPDTVRPPDATVASRSRSPMAATDSTVVDGSFNPLISPAEQSSAFTTPTSVHFFHITNSNSLPESHPETEKESTPTIERETIAGQCASQGPLLLMSNCNKYPPLQDESTVPCTYASVLIAQQNVRGMDENAIQGWLEKGFRRGKHQGDGCRVETSLLFALLDVISSS